MSRPKVSVLGAGNVGANTAQFLFWEEIADVILYDIAEGRPQGLALDLMHAAKPFRKNSLVKGTNDINEIAASDLVVITAGHRRTAEMTRDDLLHKNADVITSLVDKTQNLAPQSILIVVTNPLDAMSHLALEISGFVPNRVLGMSGVLDAARFAYFIAEEKKVAIESIETTVLGGHGEAMVPLISSCFVGSKPLQEVMDKEAIDRVVQKTRDAGADIIKLMGTSSMYAPATAVGRMAKAIFNNERAILPCSVYLQGQYGLSDVYVSVPVVLGQNGVEEIFELNLSEDELKALHRSAENVKELTKKLNLTK